MKNKIWKKQYFDKSKNKLFYDGTRLIIPKYKYKLHRKYNFKKKKPKIKFKYCYVPFFAISIIIVVSLVLFNALNLNTKNIAHKSTKIVKRKPSKNIF